MKRFTIHELLLIRETCATTNVPELLKNIDFGMINCVAFDAEEILSEFTKNANEAGIDATQLKQDIADIVLVGLSKGNLSEDRLDKFELVPKTRLEQLKNRYKIVTKTQQGEYISTSNGSMSYARSVLVFPLVALDLIKRGLHTPEPTRNLLFANELPPVFKNLGFPALIPKRNQVGSVYFYAFLAYDIEFSSMIGCSRRKSVKKRFDERCVYASARWEGKLIGFGERVEAMNKYEINTSRVLKTCLKAANKLLSMVGKDIFDSKKIMETYVDGNGVVNFELVGEGDHE